MLSSATSVLLQHTFLPCGLPLTRLTCFAADCPMVAGADSVYGIVADPCDCMNYYQCEYNTTLGEFIAYQRTCNPCEIWDQDVLTCVWDPLKPDCRFFPSTEGIGKIKFRFVDYLEHKYCFSWFSKTSSRLPMDLNRCNIVLNSCLCFPSKPVDKLIWTVVVKLTNTVAMNHRH